MDQDLKDLEEREDEEKAQEMIDNLSEFAWNLVLAMNRAYAAQILGDSHAEHGNAPTYH